jgi:hypothetical protein
MKLYSKQLNSLEELRREKHVLRYAVKHSEESLNLNDLKKDKGENSALSAGLLGTVISAFGSKSVLNTLLSIAPPILSLVAKGSSRKKTNPVQKLMKEVAFGYIKWKAVQFAYNTTMKLVHAKKKEKEAKEQLSNGQLTSHA